MSAFAVVSSEWSLVGGQSLTAQFRERAARSILALMATLFVALLLLGLALPVRASPPRSSYGLTVLLNDSHSPAIQITLQLDPLAGNGSYAFMAATMRTNVTLGPQLTWASGGEPGGWENQTQDDVNATAYFNYTAYIVPSVQQNLTTNPADTVFGTFTAVVVYTDNLGANPRTIVRAVSFALNYIAPPPPPVIAVFPAAVLGIGGAGAIGAGAYVLRRARLEELYLMHDSGMLIRHWSRTGGATHDSDIMSGMLIVLQEFVRDTWKSHQDEDAPLEQLRFGGQRVLLARGSHSVLAAVVQGRYLNGLPRKLQETVQDFERSNATVLANWNGNVDVFPKVDQIARRFLRGGPGAAA